jgi:hypothetical protein
MAEQQTQQQLPGFCRLPYDIYRKIYEDVLRPNQKVYCSDSGRGRQNGVGCTALLQVNRQIYSQTLAFINEMPNKLKMQGDGHRLFRHPLATGMPKLFISRAPTSATYIPPNLSEIEFVNLRKVTIYIYESSNEADFNELHQAVRKSRTLKEITFKCQLASLELSFVDYELKAVSKDILVEQMKDMILPIIKTCINKGIRVYAESNIKFQPIRRISSSIIHESSYQDPLVTHLQTLSVLRASNAAKEKAKAEFLAVRKEFPPRQFVLTPECRSCYAVFGSDEQLRVHLDKSPKHRISFVRKQYNWIHPLARRGGDRHTCLVCARCFVSRDSLESHVEQAKHGRSRESQGIVGKYVRDNKWYRCTGQVKRYRC